VMPSTPESTQEARLVRAFCCLVFLNDRRVCTLRAQKRPVESDYCTCRLFLRRTSAAIRLIRLPAFRGA
jgi:hypothetical protein